MIGTTRSVVSGFSQQARERLRFPLGDTRLNFNMAGVSVALFTMCSSLEVLIRFCQVYAVFGASSSMFLR